MLKFYKKTHYILIFTIFLGLLGCSSNKLSSQMEDNDSNDPFEETNREIFSINNTLDDYIFKPFARGWREIPDFPRNNLANLAETAGAPLDIANAILQLNTESIRLTVSRFLINVTFGLGGMYDVAGTPEFGSIEKREEDFGQTLASWGVPEGPFVMLPIFGPSNVRDSIGRGIDTIFNPLTITYRLNGIGFESRLPEPVVSGASTREKYLDYVEEIEKSSLDFYATMRSLYRQTRKKDINDGKEGLQSNINFDLPSYDSYFEEEISVETAGKNSTNLSIIPKDMEISNDKKTIDVKKRLPSSGYPEYNEYNSEVLTN